MALITEPRCRETSDTEGPGNIALEGAMFGSLAFSEVMATGDTADIVISYGEAFEECLVTRNSSGELERTLCRRSRHADGTVNTSHVSFGPGRKTVMMTVAAGRFAALEANALRGDVVQSFNNTWKARAQANLGIFPAGTRMLFQQTAAPTGWTKEVNHTDKVLRVVNGTVGTGGSVAFSTLFGRTATDAVTLTASNIPSLSMSAAIPSGQSPHAHGVYYAATGVASAEDKYVMSNPNPNGASGGQATANASLSALTGTAAYSNGATSFAMGIDMRVAYLDIIVAQKDW